LGAIKPADTALERAKIAPTDRSIPEVRITKVIPKAINPLAVTCKSKFSKLFAVIKLGLIHVMIIIKTIRAIIVVKELNF